GDTGPGETRQWAEVGAPRNTHQRQPGRLADRRLPVVEALDKILFQMEATLADGLHHQQASQGVFLLEPLLEGGGAFVRELIDEQLQRRLLKQLRGELA